MTDGIKALITWAIRGIAFTIVTTPLTLTYVIYSFAYRAEHLESIQIWNKSKVFQFWDFVVSVLHPGANGAAQLRILREGFAGGGSYAMLAAEMQIALLVLFVIAVVVYAHRGFVEAAIATLFALLVFYSGVDIIFGNATSGLATLGTIATVAVAIFVFKWSGLVPAVISAASVATITVILTVII